MKILIITFTKGINPGTTMQSYGVQVALKKMFPQSDIEYLDIQGFKDMRIGTKGNDVSIMDTFKQKFAAFLRLIKYTRLRKKYYRYTRPIDVFEYNKEDEDLFKCFDLVVIGSDTILEQAYGKKGQVGLNWMPFDVKKIYFAASASPANFEPTDEIKKVASDALYIGLRDNLTIDFFRNKLGIDAKRLNKQPDPSYYLDLSKFRSPRRVRNKFQTNKRFALYNFSPQFEYRKELSVRLKELGYTLVSTTYSPFSDICLDNLDAFEWAAVFPFMDIIITERFHDSLFGLRNCKPVIAIDWASDRFSASGDSKTYRILEDYNLTDYHFNLSISSNLNTICETIKNIDRTFNRKSIEEINKQIIGRANDTLNRIQSIKI